MEENKRLEDLVDYYKDRCFQLEQLFDSQRNTIDIYHKIFMLQEAELKQLRGEDK